MFCDFGLQLCFVTLGLLFNSVFGLTHPVRGVLLFSWMSK